MFKTKKRHIRLIAGIIMLNAAFVISAMLFSVHTNAETDYDREAIVNRRIEMLADIFPSNSFFTTTGTPCYGNYSGCCYSGYCEYCRLTNVLAYNENAKNTIVPEVIANGGSTIKNSCVSFASFAYAYIFGYPLEDTEHRTTLYGTYSHDFLSTLQPGDLCNIGSYHTAIFLSYDASTGVARFYEANNYSYEYKTKAACIVWYGNPYPMSSFNGYSMTVRRATGISELAINDTIGSIEIDKSNVKIYDENITLSASVNNPASLSADKLGVKIASGGSEKTYWRNISDSSSDSFTFNLADDFDKTLTAGTSYTLTLYAQYGDTTVSSGKYSFATTEDNPYVPTMKPITGFKTKSKTLTSVTLGWNKAEIVDGYIVEQYISGKWQRIAKICTPQALSLAVSELDSGTAYKFRIKSYRMIGKKAYYSKYSTLTNYTYRKPVTGFKISARSSSALRLKWNKAVSADGYLIKMYKSGQWVTVANIKDPNTLTYRIGSLSSGTAYEFLIYNYTLDNGTYIYSSYTRLRAFTKLNSVTGFKKVGGSISSIKLSWDKNPQAQGYIIEIYDDDKWIRIKKITSKNTVVYTHTGLKKGTVYRFRIKSYLILPDDTVLYSSYTTVNVPTYDKPVDSFSILGRASSALRLGWDADETADGYIIEMYADSKWKRIARIADGTATQFRYSGLSAGTEYKFRIRTFKFINNIPVYGSYSHISGMTKPSQISGFKVTGNTKNALRVGWNINTSADGYILEMYLDGKWTRVAKSTANDALQYRKAGLQSATLYKFRIKAYKMDGKKALYSGYSYTEGKTK